MPSTPAYAKAWRKKHPHYHREWMRKHRGTGLTGRNSMHGMKHILGVAVKVSLLSVSAAQAEEEFLRLTSSNS